MTAPPLTIAIDAAPAAARVPAGAGVYADRLARALPEADPGARYLSCFGLGSLWRWRHVPRADAPNARRALLDGRLPARWAPRYDLWHETGDPLPASLRGRIGAPLVATVHDASPLTMPSCDEPAVAARRRAALEETVARARLLLTPSEHVRRALVETLGAGAARVRAIPLGVDPAYRSHRLEWTAVVLQLLELVPASYVLCVGPLSSRKNPLAAVRAFAAMRAARPAAAPPLSLVLAGADRGLKRAVRADAERAGLARDDVRVLGWVPGDLLAVLFAGARALVALPLEAGAGQCVLEAYASGVPAVASRRGAYPEVAGEGAATLVEPEDVEAAGAALASACEEGPERARRIEAGRAIAAGRTWERAARETTAAYREALGLHSEGRA